MKPARVGSPVRGSRTGKPVMVLLDLLGRRMALRVLWELRGDPLTFRALMEVAETNPAVLNGRLRELRDALLVDHDGDGYHLTGDGRALLETLTPLTLWAEGWGQRVSAGETSAGS